MNITQITVSYGETQSLPEYSNVKPAITLTAVLNDSEDAAAIEADLWRTAKAAVREQIDLALEANGKAAKWSDEPRYQVMQTYWNQWDHRGQQEPPQYVIILPDAFDARAQYDKVLVHAVYPESRNMRYDHAMRVAFKAANERDAELIDCSNGDLAPLDAALAVPEGNPDVAPTSESPF